MTISEQPTELLPALLYESLPKPSPYPFDEEPAPAKSRQRHPQLRINVRIPYYPGVAFQAPTPGYPPAPLGAQHKPAPRTTGSLHHKPRPQPETRDPQPPAHTGANRDPGTPRTPAQSPAATHRTGTLAGLTGYQIRDLLIRAATPPEPVSLLNPTGEFARKVDAVRRAREAEEAIPKQHLPRRRLTMRLWRLLPVLLLLATCRHCGQAWPCHRLNRNLTQRLPSGAHIASELYDLSTRRRRDRSQRRSRTANSHRPTPRWRDRRRPKVEARLARAARTRGGLRLRRWRAARGRCRRLTALPGFDRRG